MENNRWQLRLLKIPPDVTKKHIAPHIDTKNAGKLAQTTLAAAKVAHEKSPRTTATEGNAKNNIVNEEVNQQNKNLHRRNTQMAQEYYKVQALANYNADLNTTSAEEVLNGQEIGSYVIRDSSFNKKKEPNDRGYYFAISFVDKTAEVSHRLIYVPHDERAATFSTLFEKPPEILGNGNAIVVPNIQEFLKNHSNLYKIPLVTDPAKIEKLKKEQNLLKEEIKSETKQIILNIETIQNIFHAMSSNWKSWTPKTSQVTSPAYSPEDLRNASTEMNKIKEKLISIGIKPGNDLIFLVDSGTEIGKEKIAVSIIEFNKQLNPETLNKLKSFLEQIKDYWKDLSVDAKDQRPDSFLEHASRKSLEGIESNLNPKSDFSFRGK